MNTDIIVPPSFGKALNALLSTLRDTSKFLVVGHRLRIKGLSSEIEKVAQAGEKAVFEQWVANAMDPSAHAMDLFVWRKGSMADVPMPKFLIGRNIWDLWLQSYAVRHWTSVQGGNVLFVFHPDHQKPNQALSEYQENAARAGGSEPTDCNSLDCSEFFLYAGPCRSVHEGVVETPSQTFCIR